MRKKTYAFTLIEMLVAMAITIIMASFLHVVFQTVSGTVSAGVATSDIIRSNLDSTEQLSDDARAMVGPASSGFLVILQKRITNVKLRPQDQPVSAVRADQIAWIRTLGGENPPQPVTPGNANAFGHATSNATHARVWYGHVLRTDESGTVANDLGQPGTNEAAIHWIMGRQLMFLDPAPSSSIYIDASAGTYPAWGVTGYGSFPQAPDDAWYKGLTDIFSWDLTRIRSHFDGDALNPGVGYPAGPYQFTYGLQRLWCNPNSPQGADLPAWRIAQMHSHFVANVSDLRIEFAGNYVGGLGVNLNPLGEIKWYSHFHNNPNETPQRWDGQPYNPNEPKTYKLPNYLPPVSVNGFINVDPGNLYNRALYQTFPLPHADAALTFRPNGVDWPSMIRLRYRVHDPKGTLTDRDGLLGKIFERIIYVKPI